MRQTDFQSVALWDRLAGVFSVRFTAKSEYGDRGWNGTGSGTVDVQTPDDTTIIYRESGRWMTSAGVELEFSNRFRWSFGGSANNKPDSISLEHLRYGENNPVMLFELEFHNTGVWKSVEPHICIDDQYSVEIRFSSYAMMMDWRVTGPKKNELIRYQYI